jgi:hypothetical protein
LYALQPLGSPDTRGVGCLGSGGGKATLTLTDNYFKEGEIDSLDRSRFKALIRRELKRSLHNNSLCCPYNTFVR